MGLAIQSLAELLIVRCRIKYKSVIHFHDGNGQEKPAETYYYDQVYF